MIHKTWNHLRDLGVFPRISRKLKGYYCLNISKVYLSYFCYFEGPFCCQESELKGTSDWVWAEQKICGISHGGNLKEICTPPHLGVVGCGFGRC